MPTAKNNFKQSLIWLLALLLLTQASLQEALKPAYASSILREVSVYFNERKLEFSGLPVVRGGKVYAPVRDLAAELRLYYQRHNDNQAVLYKNNLFIKVIKDTDIAYINGASVKMDGPVFEEQNRLYMPVSLLARVLDFETRWDPETATYSMASGASSVKFSVFKDSFYKKIFIDAFGVNISVPLHWNRLSSERQSYGFVDSNEQFSVELSATRQGPGTTLADWHKEVLSRVRDNPQLLAGTLGIDTLTSTRIDSQSLSYKLKQGPEILSQVIYVFLQEGIGYTLTFTYNDQIDPAYARGILRNVAESFQVDMLTIRESEEHYVEYRNFFVSGMSLNHELYSNQLAFNSQRFEGILKNPDSIEQFLITVSKGTEMLEFVVPIKDGKFSTRIFLPFGLGKHNILIETLDKNGILFSAKRDLNFEPRINYHRNNVMQFSLINISGDKIRYLVPTARIPSDHDQIESVANLLTYKDMTQYSKSRSLYRWMLENIRLDDSGDPYRRSALEVFEKSVGTEEEVGLLFAAFLRAIGIPARMTTGEGLGRQHIWVEAQINGEWRVMDLGHEIGQSGSPGILKNFFLDRERFYQGYTNIKTLNE